MKNLKQIIGVLFIALVALLLSGCESIFPESWNDPVYFGDGDNLGKSYKGSGTGNETWKGDWY